MTNRKTGTREEWLAARLELLQAEKEHTRQADELARRRQELPWIRIEKEYRFETDEGTASLAELFEDVRSCSSITSCSATGTTSTSATRAAPPARSSPTTSTPPSRISTATT